MPLQKLQFRPGLNREGTDYSNEGGWYDADKVRFRSGFPEKIGGWTRMANAQFLGLARSLWNWLALNSSNFLGVGTTVKYYIEQGGTYNDITPVIYASSPALDNCFVITSGSNVVTVIDGQYSPSVGDYGFTVTGLSGVDLTKPFSVSQNNYIHSNELVTSSVVNRALTKLYNLQLDMLQLVSPRISRALPQPNNDLP